MKNNINSIKVNYTTLQREFFRKSIHVTIAIVPLLANINRSATIVFLVLGSMFYLATEYLRMNGVNLGLITTITSIASRDRDKGITLGPLTLAMGSILALLFFSPVAASCGIYALAFGDGLSSVTGKLWGKVKIPFTNGKSYIGFLTCYTMILSTTYGITGSFNKAVLAATIGAFTELIPVKDVDNIMIPLVVALCVTI
ncbi:MAG: phosphatidate cytidylyltransferase [Spirochaetales bacterium]|nr:phosphatidate cytidylyltransferase [Spirochaetales bacterium]